MIPTGIVLPAKFRVCSNHLSSETGSSLGALAEVLGSALLDSHHDDAHCSRRGVRLAYMNPVNWAWETVGSSRKIKSLLVEEERMCACVHCFSSVWLCATRGLQPARLLCPWDFPGKNTGVGLPFPPPGHLPDPGIKLVSACVSCISGRFFYPVSHWKAPREGVLECKCPLKLFLSRTLSRDQIDHFLHIFRPSSC